MILKKLTKRRKRLDKNLKKLKKRKLFIMKLHKASKSLWR